MVLDPIKCTAQRKKNLRSVNKMRRQGNNLEITALSGALEPVTAS